MSIALKRHLAIIAMSAAATGFSGIASAAGDTPAGGTADMISLDTDHDGTVSKKEASKNKELGKKFGSLDSNKDGKLDSAEFAQFETGAAAPAPAPANPYAPSSSSTPKP